jgi:hypothetical protein
MLEGMADPREFTIKIEPDFDQPGRHRWVVSEDKKARDRSVYSFATRREAQLDADRYVEKLTSTWSDQKRT